MGRRGEEEEREGQVFLTFRMVIGRASAAPDRTSAWTVTFALHGHSWSNFVHDVASKMYVFQLKDSIFSPNRTLMLAGSYLVKFFGFPHFKNITFSSKKTTGS